MCDKLFPDFEFPKLALVSFLIIVTDFNFEANIYMLLSDNYPRYSWLWRWLFYGSKPSSSLILVWLNRINDRMWLSPWKSFSLDGRTQVCRDRSLMTYLNLDSLKFSSKMKHVLSLSGQITHVNNWRTRIRPQNFYPRLLKLLTANEIKNCHSDILPRPLWILK